VGKEGEEEEGEREDSGNVQLFAILKCAAGCPTFSLKERSG